MCQLTLYYFLSVILNTIVTGIYNNLLPDLFLLDFMNLLVLYLDSALCNMPL